MTQPPQYPWGGASTRLDSPPPAGASPPAPPPGPPRRNGTRTIVAAVLAGVFLLVARTVSTSALAHENAVSPADSNSGSAQPYPSTSASVSRVDAPNTADTDRGPHPVIALADNPFNAPGNRAVTTSCHLPPFSPTVAGQDAFYHAVLPCLMRIWAPALRHANTPVRQPSVITSGSDIDTPCGARHWDETALFCPDNNTIYMMARHYSEVEGRTDPGAYLGQFTHEFGHAVQSMTGIFEAKDDALATVGGISAAGLEVTRRNELQATCFEGMALSALQSGGVGKSYILAALQDSEQRGDEYNKQPDHGTKAINKTWVDRGFSQNQVDQCNTWSATAADVQ